MFLVWNLFESDLILVRKFYDNCMIHSSFGGSTAVSVLRINLLWIFMLSMDIICSSGFQWIIYEHSCFRYKLWMYILWILNECCVTLPNYVWIMFESWVNPMITITAVKKIESITNLLKRQILYETIFIAVNLMWILWFANYADLEKENVSLMKHMMKLYWFCKIL